MIFPGYDFFLKIFSVELNTSLMNKMPREANPYERVVTLTSTFAIRLKGRLKCLFLKIIDNMEYLVHTFYIINGLIISIIFSILFYFV